MIAAVAAGCRVRRVARTAWLCTFISSLSRQPMEIFSPVGVVVPVRREAAPCITYSDSPTTPVTGPKCNAYRTKNNTRIRYMLQVQ